ncbi:hypothetical protein [Levilactobacillus koreensis]|uniref:hypothetical protein n=2 Tax=Levilactobacillus koreensis TaxID=637971 RepID=UPI00069CEF55|nr:hypothetical protein [Levilactobacillus koreensis]
MLGERVDLNTGVNDGILRFYSFSLSRILSIVAQKVSQIFLLFSIVSVYHFAFCCIIKKLTNQEVQMSRFSDHKQAKQLLKDIENHKDHYLIIHYACESFYSTQGRSPRITAIAIKDIDSNQTKLFAIHQIAEIQQIGFDNIQARYDSLEKEMLGAFFSFVK